MNSIEDDQDRTGMLNDYESFFVNMRKMEDYLNITKRINDDRQKYLIDNRIFDNTGTKLRNPTNEEMYYLDEMEEEKNRKEIEYTNNKEKEWFINNYIQHGPQRVETGENYYVDCVSYVNTISGLNFDPIDKSLIEIESQITNHKVLIIVYFNNGLATHTGIYDKESRLVTSKIGRLHGVYKHPINMIPKSYGEHYVIFEDKFSHFISHHSYLTMSKRNKREKRKQQQQPNNQKKNRTERRTCPRR